MSRLVLRSACGALGAVVLGAACSTIEPTFRPRAGRGNATYPSIADVTPNAGRDTTLLGRPRDRATRPPNDRGHLDVRRVCRSSVFPRGFIAVGYEGASSDCPRATATGDSVAAVAVVVRYTTAPVGARLDVCADQAVPSGWSLVSDEAPGDPGACPRATRHGDTVRRIERVY